MRVVLSPLIVASVCGMVAAFPCGEHGVYKRTITQYARAPTPTLIKREEWPTLRVSDCVAYLGDSICGKNGTVKSSYCTKESESGCAWDDLEDYSGNKGIMPDGVFRFPTRMDESKGGWQLNITNESTQQFQFKPKDLSEWWQNSVDKCFSSKKYNEATCRIHVDSGNTDGTAGYVYLTLANK